jgi:hypothetical protein
LLPRQLYCFLLLFHPQTLAPRAMDYCHLLWE